MKKKIALLLSLVMAASLVSCGKKENPYEVYKAASEKLNKADSYSMKTEAKVELKAEGTDVTSIAKADAKVVNHSETDIEMLMNMETEVMGQSTTVNMYYKDGSAYVDTSGVKYKMEMNVDELLEQGNLNSMEFENEAVKDEKISKEGDMQKVEFVLEASAMENIINAQFEALGFDPSMFEMKMEDVNVTALIDKDGNLKKSDVTFSAKMEVQGTEMSFSATTTMEIDQIGGVEIDAPDLAEYGEELSFPDMGGIDAPDVDETPETVEENETQADNADESATEENADASTEEASLAESENEEATEETTAA